MNLNVTYVQVLASVGATSYLTHGSEKHVFGTQDPNVVCKIRVTDNDREMGKVFRELLYRMHHPEICVVPRDVRIHNPKNSSVVLVVWKEERSHLISNSLSVDRFIEDTRDELIANGFRDLHYKNVGRFGDRLKWFDL